MNVLTIDGRLTRDVEFSYLGQKNTPMLKFGIGVNDGYGEYKKSFFFDVVIFGKVAEWNNDLKKGELVVLNGKLTQESWNDKTTGKKMSKCVIVATDIIRPNRKKDDNNQTENYVNSVFNADPWSENK